MFHNRTKHFEVNCHFGHQKLEESDILVEYIFTTKQPADMITKALGASNLKTERDQLNLIRLTDISDFTFY